MAVELLDPVSISPLISCRLVALDKCPGVRPIGIGEVPRCIIAKTILIDVRYDIQSAVGSLQLCAGQISGVEAAVQAVRESFQKEETEAVLLVDAHNAFNCLNHKGFICPPLATILTNTYRVSSDLLSDGEVIPSQEGTTQGDPLAMPFYALATVPLMEKLSSAHHANDATAFGSVIEVKNWWDEVITHGPGFGYFVNPVKTWLVVREHCLSTAISAFSGTGVNVTHEGRPHLGSPIGSEAYINQFVREKVDLWKRELVTLSSIAQSHPHATFAAYTYGLKHKWSFLSRTTPNINDLLTPLEDTLRSLFIPSLTGKPPPNDSIRDLIAVPARLEGLGLSNPVIRAGVHVDYSPSCKVSGPLLGQILQQAITHLPVKLVALYWGRFYNKPLFTLWKWFTNRFY